MKNLVKLICLIVLMFLTAACFASVDEEELELNSTILKPFTDHFKDSNSLTRLVSLELIKIQAQKGPSNDTKERELRRTTATTTIEKRYGKKVERMRDISKKCTNFSQGLLNSNMDIAMENFVGAMFVPWDTKTVNCGFYSQMVMLAYEFNRMNRISAGKNWPFKKAVIVQTVPGTGDHAVVLVEGDSGTIFAVDPWIRKVEKLARTSKELSKLLDRSLYPDSNQLNSAFKQSYEDSDLYYDEAFINKNTQWVVLQNISQLIAKLANTNNEEMEALYQFVRPHFVNSWTFGYKSLLFSEGEFKKPENE